MKSKRIRLVSMILLLAMAFSVLAMPASAASENAWAYGVLTSNMDGSCYEWGTEAFLRDLLIQEWNTSYATEYGALTEERLQTALENGKKSLKEQNYVIYEGDIPSDAYLGYSQTKDSTIYWYSKTEFASNAGSVFSVDWGTGTLTVGTGSNQKQINALNQKASSPAADTNTGEAEPSGESVSDDSSMAVILVAGGVAVVAGVGIYLYTHPAVMQKVKNFFAGNAQASAPQQVAQTEAETGAAAENAAADAAA